VTGTLAGEVAIKTEGKPWRVVNGQQLPARSVCAIAIRANSAHQTAVLGYGGYAASTPLQPGHVYLTTDAGRHWHNITGNLPNAPVERLSYRVFGHTQRLLVKTQDRWYVQIGSSRWTPLYDATESASS
ncbi:MAG: hypothetical protein K6T83_08275, partial [Alicyclobacillus sp.]|nr:hypothetical protein [Alicyclobacillus sp.]